jgi:hypothetical protein
MAALIMADDREPRDTPGAAGAGGESQIRDDELYRMAAFRIRETANRITTLAKSAQDERLRRELLTNLRAPDEGRTGPAVPHHTALSRRSRRWSYRPVGTGAREQRRRRCGWSAAISRRSRERRPTRPRGRNPAGHRSGLKGSRWALRGRGAQRGEPPAGDAGWISRCSRTMGALHGHTLAGEGSGDGIWRHDVRDRLRDPSG